MILYFTGSGNSKYIADALAKRLYDEVISLNRVIKQNEQKRFVSQRPFVIVAPIHAWRLPRLIERLIRESAFIGCQKMYFVVTMESQTGRCDKYCENICKEIGMEFMGLRGVAMPNNYVVTSKMPQEKEVNQILKEALPQVDEIADAIQTFTKIHKTDKTPAARFLSGPVNHFFYKKLMTDRSFAVSDDCVGCTTCEKFCPINNIIMKDGRPEFQGNCINCYACIHHCPKEAININGKTENHGRYVCPEYND